MRPIEFGSEILHNFPEGSVIIEFVAPMGMEEIMGPLRTVRIPNPTYGASNVSIWEMANEEELEDFLKNKKLILVVHGNQMPPILIGAFHEEEDHTGLFSNNGQPPNDQPQFPE